MKKVRKKGKRKINYLLKNKSKKQSILPVLFAIGLLSLFSETVRTIPAGALSEKFNNISYELPELNSSLIEAKLLKKDDYQNIREKMIFERVSNKQRKMHVKIKKIKKIENIEKDIKTFKRKLKKFKQKLLKLNQKKLMKK